MSFSLVFENQEYDDKGPGKKETASLREISVKWPRNVNRIKSERV